VSRSKKLFVNIYILLVGLFAIIALLTGTFLLWSLNGDSTGVFILAVLIFSIVCSWGLFYAALFIPRNDFVLFPFVYILSNLGFIILPSIYAIFTRDFESVSIWSSVELWTIGILMQSLFLFFWLLGYFVIGPKFYQFYAARTLLYNEKMSINAQWLILICLWIIGSLSFFRAFKQGLLFYGALDKMTSEGLPLGGSYLIGFLSSFFLPSSIVLIFFRKENTNLWSRSILAYAGLFSLLAYMLISVLVHAQRIVFIETCTMLLGGVALTRGKFRMSKVATILMLAFVVTILFTGPFSEYRQGIFGTYGISPPLFKLASDMSGFVGSYSMIENLRALLVRMDLAQNAGILFDYANKHGFAGFTPYKGVVASWVPRIIWENKPFPGSYDGSIATHPAFLLGSMQSGAVGGYHTMTKPSSGAMYLHFGWIGIIIGGLIVGIIWRLIINNFTRNQNVVGMLIVIILLKEIIVPQDSLDTALLFVMKYLIPMLFLNRMLRLKTKM